MSKKRCKKIVIVIILIIITLYILNYLLASIGTDFEGEGDQFAICRNASWQINRGLGWTDYKCTHYCTEQEWSKCQYYSEKSDYKGEQLKMLAFVVDGIGGELRWNNQYKNYTGALLIHHGGGGTAFTDSEQMTAFRHHLENEGLVVIGLRWQKGYKKMGGLAGAGYFTNNKPNEQSNLFEKSKRPAEIMRWVRDNLVPKDVRFGTFGCSGGSTATFSPVYWHGLDEKIDYQLLGGGPPAAWDINAVCTEYPGEEQPVGICERNPEIYCSSDSECDGASKCAFLKPAKNPTAIAIVIGTKGLIDYVHRIKDCTQKKHNPDFDASSYRLTHGDWQYNHPVDFIVDIEGMSSTGKILDKILNAIFNSDTLITVLYTAGMTYNSISTTDPAGKKWITHLGAHCSWLRDSEFLKNTVKPRVLQGLQIKN